METEKIGAVDGDVVETVELLPDAGTDTLPADGKDAGAADTSEDGKGKAEGDENAAGDNKQVDESKWSAGTKTRFDEMNTRMKTAEGQVPELKIELAKLQGQIEVLGKKPAAEDTAGESPPDFMTEMSNMEPDDLRDKFDDDPANFLKDFAAGIVAQVSEANAGQTKEQEFENRVVGTIGEFAKEHTDFDGLWDSGEIMKHMDANPGLDAVGSYYALTKDSREADVQKRIDAEVKKTEEKYQKHLKREHSSLPGGPAATAGGGDTPASLQDTKKYGGLVRSIAARVLEKRQSA